MLRRECGDGWRRGGAVGGGLQPAEGWCWMVKLTPSWVCGYKLSRRTYLSKGWTFLVSGQLAERPDFKTFENFTSQAHFAFYSNCKRHCAM